MTFPMAWRTSRRADNASVTNGRIAFDEFGSDQALLQGMRPNTTAYYQAMAGRKAFPEVLEAAAPTVGNSQRYEAPVGAIPRINAKRHYRQEGRDVMAGYLNNPLEEDGRKAMLSQLMSAPLGGHLRAALQGQEVLGRTITNAQARMAEQAAAGVLATGIGSWGLLSAIDALNGNQQTPGTIPMS